MRDTQVHVIGKETIEQWSDLMQSSRSRSTLPSESARWKCLQWVQAAHGHTMTFRRGNARPACGYPLGAHKLFLETPRNSLLAFPQCELCVMCRFLKVAGRPGEIFSFSVILNHWNSVILPTMAHLSKSRVSLVVVSVTVTVVLMAVGE